MTEHLFKEVNTTLTATEVEMLVHKYGKIIVMWITQTGGLWAMTLKAYDDGIYEYHVNTMTKGSRVDLQTYDSNIRYKVFVSGRTILELK